MAADLPFSDWGTPLPVIGPEASSTTESGDGPFGVGDNRIRDAQQIGLGVISNALSPELSNSSRANHYEFHPALRSE